MNWYKKAQLTPEEILAKEYGFRFKKIKAKTFQCPKCKKDGAYFREEHPDTDMNEIVKYCPDCGELE